MSTSRAKKRRPRSGGPKSSARSVTRPRGASRARPQSAPRATALALDLTAERRAELLQADARNAILKTRKALKEQFRAALEANEVDSAEQIRESISALTAQLDELSRTSLNALEESAEVKQTIANLTASAKALEAEAAQITDLASALRKGAQAVQKATDIVGSLKRLIPIG